MPHLTTPDGVRLYFEESGSGLPIVFVHEFAGDHRSWAPQVHHFSRRYRCIVYSARGYPPSDVPESVEMYSQKHARDDILAVMDALGVEKAHVVGLSMGAFATVHFAMNYPDRLLGAVAAGVGYGAHPDDYPAFQAHARDNAAVMREKGMVHFAATYGHGASRLQFRDKDPAGFRLFIEQFEAHSATGSANTMEGYQARRPSLYVLQDRLATIETPMLIVAGDEDDATLQPSLMLKQTIRSAGLAVLPCTGHVINLEEPALFNRVVEDFLHQVERGRWPVRPWKT